MDTDYSFQKLVTEMKAKLDRELEEKELQFIHWMAEKHVDSFYKNAKSS